MDENNKNLITAFVLATLVLIGWRYFIANPAIERQAAKQDAINKPVAAGKTPTPSANRTPKPGTSPTPSAIKPVTVTQTRDTLVKQGPRVAIKNNVVEGSILLKGARFDDIVLTKYNKKLNDPSQKIALLSPEHSPFGYYSEFGWASAGNEQKVPNSQTLWTQTSGTSLTPSSPIELSYDNGQGLIFKRKLSVDENYMFTVTQEVENKGNKTVTLYPYAVLVRHNTPEHSELYISHEGLVGFNEEDGLTEITYDEAIDQRQKKTEGRKGGWLAITDKYWASAIIPPQGETYTSSFSGAKNHGKSFFQSDYILTGRTIAPGEKTVNQSHLFAGAKEANLINAYQEDDKIQKFDLMIDWGWFYFITKPVHWLLIKIQSFVGNFGIAIILATVLIKAVLFPLANKSYASMSKMKKMQPEMEALKKRYGEDKVRLQKAMLELYKKEKINPMSGCWPILIQIPIFFALYKVLYVTIDMRHAPFFGWIQDLSAPDPTSIVNLFGLLPFDVPSYLQLGIWPIIMGLTMWLQMKLNPAPTDPVQQAIFKWMPVIFTIMLGGFAAGLVIYWAWNNILSIIQQYTIMKRMGVEVDLLGNMGLRKDKAKP